MTSALHHRFRPLAVLALLAFLLAALVPAGFMPVSDAGKTEIVICTGQGPMVRAVDSAQLPFLAGSQKAPQSPAKKDAGKSDFACPYAPVLAQGNGGLALILAAVWQAGDIFSLPATALLPSIHAVKPWQSQGPPAAV